MEEKDIIRITVAAHRKSQWGNVVDREIAVNSYNLGVSDSIDKTYTKEDILKAIYYLPYHIEYGNITGRLPKEDIADWIESIKTEA